MTNTEQLTEALRLLRIVKDYAEKLTRHPIWDTEENDNVIVSIDKLLEGDV